MLGSRNGHVVCFLVDGRLTLGRRAPVEASVAIDLTLKLQLIRVFLGVAEICEVF